jgi:23S rRNA pseudouridine955/2504/2580 synthase
VQKLVKNIIGGKQTVSSVPLPLTPVSAAQGAKSELKVTLVTVDESSEGQRLDNFLLRELKGVPKTHVYRIIRSGEVRVNKGRAQADTRLAAGDVVRLPPVRISEHVAEKAAAMADAMTNRPAPARSFPILFEDEYFLAIDKPAGVAVHGGSGVSFGVIEQLRMARPGAKYLELVHRLDRDTSGILLIAKKRSALVHLQQQFKDRETGKTYLALVKGAWPANKKVIDQPLHKYLVDGGEDDGERRVKVVAKDDPNGMRSVTLVKIAKTIQVSFAAPAVRSERVKGKAPAHPNAGQADTFTLLEVTIKTGRTHQIRVHLAGNGYPIVGDDKYGDFALNKALQKRGFKRMFLHAWHLQVQHPATQAELTFACALPASLAHAWGLSIGTKD